MSDIPTRVSQCFANVFPALAEADIPKARQESLAQWDSIAHITLLSAVAEEFGLELDDEALVNLTSFDAVVDYVTARNGAK